MTLTSPALTHRALLYDTEAQFVTGTVPFLRAGLAKNEIVLAIAPGRRLDALCGALGDEARRVRMVDAASFYHHPVRTIATYDDLVRTHGTRGIRGVGELPWPAFDRIETTEWMRFEATINAVFADYDGKALCCYDTRTTSARVLDGALRTHRELIGGVLPAARYAEPADFSAGLDRRPLPPPPPRVDSLPIEPGGLAALRDFVTGRASRHGMARARLAPFLAAAVEVAANALRHGAPPVVVRVWCENGHLVCEVADHGRWRPSPLLGLIPPQPPRLGLWGVRMLADVVQVRAGTTGTVVRVRSALTGRPQDGDLPPGTARPPITARSRCGLLTGEFDPVW